MKVLVVSDNHRDEHSLKELINIYENKIDLWLHCGDSEFSAAHPIWNTFKTVSGNMDRPGEFPNYLVESKDGVSFVVVHGHNHQVKFSLEPMAALAAENQARVVFYGHTHIPKVDEQDGVYFINPGSIIQPRGLIREGSYAIYEKNDTEESIKFFDWNHNLIDNLSQKLN